MSFQSLKKVLTQKYRHSPLMKGVTAALVCEEFSASIKRRWGEEVARHCQPKYLQDKILTIQCSSTVLAQEVRLREEEIIQEINEKFGSQTVRSLRFW